MKCARGQECWDSHQHVDGNPRCSVIAAIGYITRATSVAAAVTAGTPWKISQHVFPRLVTQCETMILIQRLSLGNGSCRSSHPKKAAILLTKNTLMHTHTFTPTCIYFHFHFISSYFRHWMFTVSAHTLSTHSQMCKNHKHMHTFSACAGSWGVRSKWQ